MSYVSSDQLTEIHQRIRARYAEFERTTFEPPAKGDVRLIIDVYEEWMNDESIKPPPEGTKDTAQADLVSDMFFAGTERGKAMVCESNGSRTPQLGIGSSTPVTDTRMVRNPIAITHDDLDDDEEDERAKREREEEEELNGNWLGSEEGRAAIRAAINEAFDELVRALRGEATPADAQSVAESPADGSPNRDEKITQETAAENPNERASAAPEVATEPRPEGSREPHAAIFDLIRSLAQDGIMPRQSEYDEAKADNMPSAARLKQITGMSWGDLATELGLTMLTPIERAHLQRSAQAEQAEDTPSAEAAPPNAGSASNAEKISPEVISQPRTVAEVDAEETAKAKRAELAETQRQRRIALREKAFALLRSLAVDEQMPPISLYNERCAEAEVPEARLLLNNLGCMDWGEVAQMAGLKWFGRRVVKATR